MVIAVRTESGPEGLTIVKTAGSDAERIGLAREAELLTRASHPGVIEVIDHTPDELRLRHAGTTLTHLLPLAADHAASVVCALAEVLGAVHAAGVAHGQIGSDHVVLDRAGRPRLCGFGQATAIEDGSAQAAADDVAALGALFDKLLDEAAHVPWTPANAGARHRTRRKHAREIFRNVAGMAQRSDPRQRIAPHQMANAIREALPALELPTPPAPVLDEDGLPLSSAPQRLEEADTAETIEWSPLELEYLAGQDDSPPEPEWESDAEAVTAIEPEPEPDPEPEPEPESLTRARTQPTRTRPEPDSHPEPRTPTKPRTRPETPRRMPEAPAATGEHPDADGARERLERALASGPPPITIRESSLSTERRRRRVAPEPEPEKPESRRNLILMAGIVLVAGIILAPLLAWALGAFDGDDPADDVADAAETDTPITDVDDSPVTPTTWPAECELPSLTGPDMDDDGCPEPVTVNGRNVVVGDLPIAFGEDGDLVAVGDTDCDGVVTPYLLRPGTGQVFVWSEWPLDSAVQVRSFHDIAGATGIERRDGSMCDVIVVTGAGETVVAGTP